MKNYYLYLDESGDFKGESSKPSIIAGLMSVDTSCTESRAEKFFEDVKKNNSDFAEIDTDPFHAMEEKDIHLAQFIVELMEHMAKQNISFVVFKNQRHYNIVNSDVTYLNVFAEGIVNLAKKLIAETEDKVTLNIVYAKRINVKELDTKANILNIKATEYTERIEERIFWRISHLNHEQRDRIQINLTRGSATTLKSLMLADAVCFALRGGQSKFITEQKRRIENLPCEKFYLMDGTSWSSIQDYLIEDRLADALYSVYGSEKPALSEEYMKRFNDILINKFKEIGASARKLQYDTISQTISTLVDRRAYDETIYFIDALEQNFFPLLKNENLEYTEFYFDLHFYKLTVVTHQGNTLEEQKEIDICRKILPSLPATCETLDYYLKYKLREVEHLKNIYDFENALIELDKLENTLSNMVDLVQMLDGLDEFGKHINSTTLGRVIGSRVATKIYLAYTDRKYIESARKDSDTAIKNFTSKADKARQYQARAMLETVAEKYDDALEWLGKAFDVEENVTAEKVLKSIINFQGLKVFGFLHYVNLMSAAMTAGNSLGKSMYVAWIHQNPEITFSPNMEYPLPLIYHKIGKCRALQKNEDALKYYDEAIKVYFADSKKFTSYAAGLLIEADLFLTMPTKKYMKRLTKLCNDYKKFAAADIPESMRKTFADWDCLEEKIVKDSEKEIREYLANITKKVPFI